MNRSGIDVKTTFTASRSIAIDTASPIAAMGMRSPSNGILLDMLSPFHSRPKETYHELSLSTAPRTGSALSPK